MIKTILFQPDKKCPLWVDVIDPTEDDLLQLASEYGLSKEIVTDCLDGEHLPKYEETSNFTFIIARLYDKDSDLDANNVIKLTRRIAIYYSETVLLTIHRVKFDFLEDIASKLPQYVARPKFNMFHLLAVFMDKVLSSYIPLSETYSQQLEYYEDMLFLSKNTPDLTKNFYLIKRKASIVKSIINISKDIVNKLESNASGPFVQDLKDTYTDVESSFAQIIENSGYLINTYLSITAQRTNEIMRTLTILSVFSMPLTFIVGVYGMNFPNIPEFDFPYGYITVWAVMIGICAFIYLYFKRKRWI